MSDLVERLRKYQRTHAEKCGKIDWGPCQYCRDHREAATRIEDMQAKLDAVEEYYRILEAKLDAVSNGLHLPKITPEIEDLLQGSYLIENGDWTQDAVEFVCILAKAIGEQE